MSPEQAAAGRGRPEPTCTRSAACSTRCSRASRRSPAARPQALIAKRVLEPVPHVRTLRESVPESVEQALTRALAKVPADRFQTAAEFARALAASTVSPAAGLVPAAATTPALRRRPHHRCRCRGRRVPPLYALGFGILLGVGVCFAWLAYPPEVPRPLVEAGWPCSPSRTSAGPRTSTSPTACTDACGGSSTALPGLQVIARSSSAEYKKSTKSPQADRAGARGGLPADRDGALAARPKRAEPGAGEPRAGPGLHRGDSVAGSPSTLRSPTCSRCRPTLPGQVAQALDVALGAGEREQLAERPTQNLAAYDAFLRGEEAVGGNTTVRPRGAPAGARLLRAGGGPRFELRPRLGSALAGVLASLLERPEPRSGGGGSPGRRAFAGARARAPGRSSGPRHLLRRGAAGRTTRARAVHDGAAARPQGRPAPGLRRVG